MSVGIITSAGRAHGCGVQRPGRAAINPSNVGDSSARDASASTPTHAEVSAASNLSGFPARAANARRPASSRRSVSSRPNREIAPRQAEMLPMPESPRWQRTRLESCDQFLVCHTIKDITISYVELVVGWSAFPGSLPCVPKVISEVMQLGTDHLTTGNWDPVTDPNLSPGTRTAPNLERGGGGTVRAFLRLVIVLIVVGPPRRSCWAGGSSRTWSHGRAVRRRVVGRRVTARSGLEIGAQVGEKTAEVANVASAPTDGQITAKIKAKMALDDTVKALAVDVDTTGPIVTVSGTVDPKRSASASSNLLARPTASAGRRSSARALIDLRRCLSPAAAVVTWYGATLRRSVLSSRGVCHGLPASRSELVAVVIAGGRDAARAGESGARGYREGDGRLDDLLPACRDQRGRPHVPIERHRSTSASAMLSASSRPGYPQRSPAPASRRGRPFCHRRRRPAAR